MSDVVFRVDSSKDMGIGHLMRCLTLANALRQQGVNSWFICRKLLGDRTDLIALQGYQFHLLPQLGSDCDLDSWLATNWQQDALECQHLLYDHPPLALVVDHYGLDSRWEQKLQQQLPGCPLLVIDDLANRTHSGSALLDQTLDRCASAYHALLPQTSQLWLGSSYTLLREEFSAPPATRHAPEPGEPWRILVSLGGTDPDNHTLAILDSLAPLEDLGIATEICVIMGKTAPHLASVSEWCQHHGQQLLIDCNKMAEQLDWAHVAIGAGGTSASERCARGLPSLLLIMADNQRLVCKSLAAHGSAINLGPCSPFPTTRLREELIHLLHSKIHYEQMVASGYQIYDGAGAVRVATSLLAQARAEEVRLYPMGKQESEQLWRWQCESSMRRYFRNPNPPTWPEHKQWFTKVLADPDVRLFRIEYQGEAVGMFRLDSKDAATAEVSLLISAHYQGKGIAKRALKLIQTTYPELHLLAEVHPENLASRHLFTQAGFHTLDTNLLDFITTQESKSE